MGGKSGILCGTVPRDSMATFAGLLHQEYRISATKQNNLPLKLCDICVTHIQQDDLRLQVFQPAVIAGGLLVGKFPVGIWFRHRGVHCLLPGV